MKRIVTIALTAVMMMTIGVSASAESYTSSGWSAVFDGKGITTNYSSGDIAAEMGKIEPGDDVTMEITLKNGTSGASAWYMTNAVLQSLEESKSSANGGAYAYNLSYRGPDGKVSTIFDSKVSGGEKGDIKQTTEGLETYFYVGDLAAGQNGTVSLKVSMNGETEGNSYMSTLAKLQMNFAVDTSTSKINKYYAAKTADSYDIYIWGAILLLSTAAVIYLSINRRKSRKDTDV